MSGVWVDGWLRLGRGSVSGLWKRVDVLGCGS